MIGSDSLYNVGWTAPTLILGGHMIQSRLGSLRTAKLFFGSLVMSYFFMSAFGPGSFMRDFELLKHAPFNMLQPCVSNPADGSYMMGADPMAISLLYFGMAHSGMWWLLFPCLAFDMSVFGPKCMGGSVAGIGAALCL